MYLGAGSVPPSAGGSGGMTKTVCSLFCDSSSSNSLVSSDDSPSTCSEDHILSDADNYDFDKKHTLQMKINNYKLIAIYYALPVRQ